jgi:hypothetical protein
MYNGSQNPSLRSVHSFWQNARLVTYSYDTPISMLPDWSQALQLSHLKLHNLNHWRNLTNNTNEKYCLLRSDALRSSVSLPTFHRIVLSPFSGSKSKPCEYATRRNKRERESSHVSTDNDSSNVGKFLPPRQQINEQPHWSGNVSGGGWFESRPTHRLSPVNVFVSFFNPSKRMQE